MKQAPYTWDDASYLTQRSLSAPLDAWRNVGKNSQRFFPVKGKGNSHFVGVTCVLVFLFLG